MPVGALSREAAQQFLSEVIPTSLTIHVGFSLDQCRHQRGLVACYGRRQDEEMQEIKAYGGWRKGWWGSCRSSWWDR